MEDVAFIICVNNNKAASCFIVWMNKPRRNKFYDL